MEKQEGTSDHRSSDLTALIERALTHHRAQQLPAAQSLYNEILRTHPNHPDALHLLGLIAHQSKHYNRALQLFDRAIQINPAFAPYYSNRGNTLRALKQFPSALQSFDQAISLDPLYAEAYFNRGVLLQQLMRYQDALESYDQALSLNANLAEAHNNRGNTLKGLQRYQQALDSFAKALQRGADPAEIHINCGNVFLETRNFSAAVDHYSQALPQTYALCPEQAQTYLNRGVAHLGKKHYREALNDFNQVHQLDPNLPWVKGLQIHARQYLCEWTNIEAEIANIESLLARGRRVITPFSLLSICDSPKLQRRAAEIAIQSRFSASTNFVPAPHHPIHQRIRLAYISSDFQNHPVSYHMAQVFERHDRDKFELYGLSTGPDTGDDMRLRVAKAMHRFYDLQSVSDAAVVHLCHRLEIDIAIDLNGLCYGDRTPIFARRAAPIQVNYLGYPGTMGAPFIDYILADQILIPPTSRQHYSEKIVYLPGTFQANASDQLAPTLDFARSFTRTLERLPAVGFIYCCFNNSYKIMPATFDTWMRILNRVKDSVLWLLQSDPEAAINLQNRAAQRGIDPSRLIFAQPLSLPDHIARQQLAGLFLDTHPFNAGATASAALRAGLPVLTRIGHSFSGRMAASLLNAVGMPDLVTDSNKAYEELAVGIGANPAVAQNLKDRLRHNQLATPFFDSQTFTLNLESAYAAMYARHSAGLAPDQIKVAVGSIANHPPLPTNPLRPITRHNC